MTDTMTYDNMYAAAAKLAATYADQGKITPGTAAQIIAAVGPSVANTINTLRQCGDSHDRIAATFRARLETAQPARKFAAELFVAMHEGYRIDEAAAARAQFWAR